MKDRQILFAYYKENGRSTVDCGDLYNWLLDQDESIASKFLEKWDNAKLKNQPSMSIPTRNFKGGDTK